MIIACIISFVVGAVLMLFVVAMAAMAKEREPRNKVHFYLVQTSFKTFDLFLGCPAKVFSSRGVQWIGNRFYVDSLKDYGLNPDNYRDLDYNKPIEVFLNSED